MQELAANYLEHFTLDFGDQVNVSLAGAAPEDLLELERFIREQYGSDKIVCLYEALCVVADSELPHCAEVDEKVCPLEIYYRVVDFLGARAFPANGGV